MTEITQSPETFEMAVERYERALGSEPTSHWIDLTIQLVDDLTKICSAIGLLEAGNRAYAVEHWYTRAAAAITGCIVHPGVNITSTQLDAIARRTQPITYIFQASGYRSMRHLPPLMGTPRDTGLSIPKEKVAVLLAFIGLDDLTPDLMDLALSQPARILLPLMIGWLNERAVLTDRAEKNRSKLLASGQLIEDAEIDDSMIGSVVNAWMYSTYADSVDKHAIKTSLNLLLTNLMTRAGIASKEPTPSGAAKPRVLVIHERFREQHAMFRCYAPLITSLKPHFEISAMAEELNIDRASDTIFENFIKLGDGPKPIRKLVEAIERIRPDIVYYPSLGMSHWTVMLAQLRLAPIQIMSHGHPATSMTDTIDYVYLPETDHNIAAKVSEKILMGEANPTFAPHPNLPKTLPKLVAPTRREVRVAVNCKVMKLSYRLLDICRRLSEEAAVPVKFSFFPGERGLYFDGLSASIRASLPDSTVVPYVDYPTFLREIAKCDLALAAFPFGNTNSTVDTCLLGLPTVAHYGDDTASQTDALVLKAAGYPEWLICKTDQSYFDTAMSLILDVEKRLSVAENISQAEVQQKLFKLNAEDSRDATFADLFKYVHENHSSMQKSSERVFSSAVLLGGQA